MVYDWEGAAPLYRKAELLFIAQHEASKALYARVSQVPILMEVSSLPDQIWRLSQNLPCGRLRMRKRDSES